MTKRELLAFGLILIAFLSFRIPAVHNPYHQDEYKWVLYAHPEIIQPGTVPHPPLTEFIYTKIGPLVGDNNFRTIPLVFSIANLFLLFFLARTLFKDTKTALWVISLFTIIFYSVLASVMVDVDGAIMVFFFLVMSLGYFKWKSSNWMQWKWLVVVVIGALGGYFLKVSGLLPLVALVLDFGIEKNLFRNKKKILLFAAYSLGAAIALALILVASKFIFPTFNLEYSLHYWEHFVVFKGRGWFQTFIQFSKGILYSSPLIIIPAFFVDRELWQKTRAFFFFLFIGLFFYLIAFDFSLGALDRYLQFMVVPLSIISGAVLAQHINAKPNKKYFSIFAIIAAIVFFFQFAKHGVPPLYPKTEWLHRLVAFKWNFLFPFTGGSGPSGFYISFLFMVLMWAFALVLVGLYLAKRLSKTNMLVGLLVLGAVYNATFIQEYLFGKINGSSPTLIKHAAAFIANDPSIQKVTVYNDAGGWNVRAANKYLRRLYIDPKFDIQEKIDWLNNNKYHYMVVDVPHIDENTIYTKYFATCTTVFFEQSGVISAHVYDCRNAKNISQ